MASFALIFVGSRFSCGSTLGTNQWRGWEGCSKTWDQFSYQPGLSFIKTIAPSSIRILAELLQKWEGGCTPISQKWEGSCVHKAHLQIWDLYKTNNIKPIHLVFTLLPQVDDVLLKKDVALIIILCPPSLHSQIAVKALGIGKHVVCGVPGGLGQAECLRMVQVQLAGALNMGSSCAWMFQAAQYYPSLMAVLAYGQRFLPSMVGSLFFDNCKA